MENELAELVSELEVLEKDLILDNTQAPDSGGSSILTQDSCASNNCKQIRSRFNCKDVQDMTIDMSIIEKENCANDVSPDNVDDEIVLLNMEQNMFDDDVNENGQEKDYVNNVTQEDM